MAALTCGSGKSREFNRPSIEHSHFIDVVFVVVYCRKYDA